MNEELKQYQVTPDRTWQQASLYGDGYSVMEVARTWGWHPIANWGKDGYDLGSWPYVILFFRTRQGRYDLVYYVEGDVTMYSCPTKELRQAITDELAFSHWKHQDEEWVRGYESVEQLPAELRGPYRG